METSVPSVINPKELYAGFWKRLAAHICDQMLLNLAFLLIMQWILGFVIGLFLGIVGYKVHGAQDPLITYLVIALNYVIILLYYAFLESSSRQGTLGKQVMKIIVVDQQFQQLPFWRAFSRCFIMLIPLSMFSTVHLEIDSWIRAIGIGLWISMVLAVTWTKKSQGLHDLLTGCLVVNKDVVQQYTAIPVIDGKTPLDL